jgi:NaMN:DMB phosphoribosyltransferase
VPALRGHDSDAYDGSSSEVSAAAMKNLACLDRLMRDWLASLTRVGDRGIAAMAATALQLQQDLQAPGASGAPARRRYAAELYVTPR